MNFYRAGAIPTPRPRRGTSAGLTAGIEAALRRILVSPDFLFRAEQDPAGARPGQAYRISDLELASRLSFFLWSSIPDDELLDAAARGELRQPPVLERQVRRMLADPRSRALVTNFAGQWLWVRNIRLHQPDPSVFPEFDENLRQALEREIQLFLDSQIRDDRGIPELLTADYTFVNERLARHYGIPNVYGNHFRRITRDGRRAERAVGQGRAPDGDVVPQSHVTGLSRQVAAREPARRPAAAAAARRAGAAGERRRSRAALGPRADGAAPIEPGLRGLPQGDGSARLRARELRRHRPLALR